jgi:hypothetical protein
MAEWQLYLTMIWVLLALAVLSFVLLMFIPAPYGRHVRSGWGPVGPARVGWIAMETPAVLVFAWAFFAGRALAQPGAARAVHAVASALRPSCVRLSVPNARRKADDAMVAAFVALLDDRAPHQCNKTSTGLENSIHLAHCFAPIGKVLETELTERDVKKRLRKRAALQHLLHAILPLHPVGVARSGPLQACLD